MHLDLWTHFHRERNKIVQLMRERAYCPLTFDNLARRQHSTLSSHIEQFGKTTTQHVHGSQNCVGKLCLRIWKCVVTIARYQTTWYRYWWTEYWHVQKAAYVMWLVQCCCQWNVLYEFVREHFLHQWSFSVVCLCYLFVILALFFFQMMST